MDPAARPRVTMTMSNDTPPADPDAGPAGPTKKRRGLDGRVLGGRYRVTRTVAAGANTLIADAIDQDLDRQVTVKLVRPELSESEEFRRRLRQQMEEMAALSHPNLAAVYDWGEERIGKRVTVYVVCEYLSGGSLRDLFDRKRYLTPSQALMVGLEACRGLDFAHRKGLVHTELTPSKLVFGDDRRLRIVDFGLARILNEQTWTEPSQLPTHVARYASPEQAQSGQPDAEPIDGKTDVYSLALILIEAVTGSIPFAGDSTVSTLSARIGKLMRVSADLGPLASVLERAGRPEAAERASASQLGRALVQTAGKLARPTPIPILSAGPFGDDPEALRRPDDPTGGIARPPDEPAPVLVPPAAGASPAAVAKRGRGRQDRSKSDDRAAGAAAAVTDETQPAPAAEPDTSAGAPATDGSDGGKPAAGNVDLAALVERTPPAPPPDDAGGRAGRKARRQAKRAERAGGPAAVDREGQRTRDRTGGAPRRRRWLSALFGVVLVAALAVLGLLAWRLFRTPTHEVPAVAGMTEQDALLAVQEFGWDVRTDLTRDDTFDQPGQAVRTSPAAGYELAEGSPLTIYISQGPEFRQLPDLANVPLEQATAALEELRLVPGEPARRFDEDVPAGVVISAGVEGTPIGGDVLPGTTVSLVVSRGPEPRTVPSLRGLTEEEATQLLDQFGLQLDIGEAVFSDSVASGRIVEQTPAANEELARGGTVTAAPSKGPDLVAIPDLSGQTLAQIRETLADSGLQAGAVVGSTQGVFYSASVDGDEVEIGEQVRRGSTVDLFVFPPDTP